MVDMVYTYRQQFPGWDSGPRTTGHWRWLRPPARLESVTTSLLFPTQNPQCGYFLIRYRPRLMIWFVTAPLSPQPSSLGLYTNLYSLTGTFGACTRLYSISRCWSDEVLIIAWNPSVARHQFQSSASSQYGCPDAKYSLGRGSVFSDMLLWEYQFLSPFDAADAGRRCHQ